MKTQKCSQKRDPKSFPSLRKCNTGQICKPFFEAHINCVVFTQSVDLFGGARKGSVPRHYLRFHLVPSAYRISLTAVSITNRPINLPFFTKGS